MARNLEYSWKMLHPKFGWMGGDDSDEWHADRAVAESRASLCQYEIEIVSRPLKVVPSKVTGKK